MCATNVPQIQVERSKKEFKLFESEVHYWLNELQLNEWEVYTILENDNDDSDASCSPDLSSQQAIIKLNAYIISEDEKDDDIIKGCALHEVLELLLAELRILAMERTFSYEQYDAASHRVIHKIQRLLEEYDKQNRKATRSKKRATKKTTTCMSVNRGKAGS